MHYVKSHQNIIGNELADIHAKKSIEINTIESQNNSSIPLSNLKYYLKLNLSNKWYQSKSKLHN